MVRAPREKPQAPITAPRPVRPSGMTYVAVYAPDEERQVRALRLLLERAPQCEEQDLAAKEAA